MQIFSAEGHSIRIIGGRGDGLCQFDHPWGLTCDKNGIIVVGDKNNHRIQVLSREGAFIMQFGEYGKAEDQCKYPKNPVFDNDGNILFGTGNGKIYSFGQQ